MHDIRNVRISQPCQSHMGCEFTRIGGNAKPLANAFDFALQCVEFRRGGYARIDAVRLLGTESIDT
ncbi:hypothetical protein A8A54_00190 [Brucella pseudogrignonensis]|nr:hypothetical protein A8A54_00190 [Brucella pseudogrignonensis]